MLLQHFIYPNSLKYYNNNQNVNLTYSIRKDDKTELMDIYNRNAKKIEELKSNLLNYDYKLDEISKLKIKINNLNRLIKSKNKIIKDYEYLSNLTKEKFVYYMNNNNNEDNFKDYEKYLEENELLLKVYWDLKEENDYYKKEIENQTKTNFDRINKIRNELKDVKNKVNKNANRSQIIENENKDYNDEIIKLKNKLNNYNNIIGQIDELKYKYNMIEKKFNEKNRIKKELEKENDNLKSLYNSINNNYQNIFLNNQELKLKIKEYEELYNNYVN